MKNRQIPTFANLIPHHVFFLGGGGRVGGREAQRAQNCGERQEVEITWRMVSLLVFAQQKKKRLLQQLQEISH